MQRAPQHELRMLRMPPSEPSNIAVIAGVGPGLGAALCRKLHSAGQRVVALTRAADCVEVREHLPADVTLLPCELAEPTEVARCFDQVEARLGPCEVLVYNAGQLLVAPFVETSIEDMEACWRTNYWGGFLCAKRALPGMLQRRSGAIVFTGASASLVGKARYSACAASKFGLRGLAQSLAEECEDTGVSIAHVVVDGLIWSEKIRKKFGVAPEDCFAPDSLAEAFVRVLENRRTWRCRELVLGPVATHS